MADARKRRNIIIGLSAGAAGLLLCCCPLGFLGLLVAVPKPPKPAAEVASPAVQTPEAPAPQQQTAVPAADTSATPPPEPPPSPTPAREAAIHPFFELPAGFVPAYRVAEKEDLSFAGGKRIQWRITLPPGLAKEQVEANLRHATLIAWTQERPRAVSIAAYKDGDDIHGAFTAGKVTFAPFGKWNRATEEVSLARYDGEVEVSPTYLNPASTFAVGATVRLGKDTLFTTSPTKWSKEYRLPSPPAGTEATVLEVRRYPTGDMESVSYRMRLSLGGKEQEGWVGSFSIETPLPEK